MADQRDWLVRVIKRFQQSDGNRIFSKIPHRAMSTRIEHSIEILRHGRKLCCISKGTLGLFAVLEARRCGCLIFGEIAFGSSGGWPPLGEASVIWTSASLKTKYGAAT